MFRLSDLTAIVALGDEKLQHGSDFRRYAEGAKVRSASDLYLRVNALG